MIIIVVIDMFGFYEVFNFFLGLYCLIVMVKGYGVIV